MKKSLQVILLCLFCFSMQTCKDKCKITNTYTYYRPVYMTSLEVRNAVTFETPRAIKKPGKIYFKDQYLYINETGEGIHIIDNQNPRGPVPVGFLKIPGSYDLSMVNDLLYADSFVDLVVFDVSDKSNIHEVNRVEGVFDQTQSYGFGISSGSLVLKGWEPVTTLYMEESECAQVFQSWGGIYYEDGIALANYTSTGSATFIPSVQPATTGIGGSLARFTVTQNTLYALNGAILEVINISNPGSPFTMKSQSTNWDVETLFPYQDKLFMGSRTGMYIYDLSSPANPKYLSKYEHVFSCDPVVVSGSRAYVTLRSGNLCRANINQLEVIDISNPLSPSLLSVHPMTNPYGLGIDATTLFICDGVDGLKIYNAADHKTISTNLLAHYQGIKALDVIPFQHVAMVITEDGLYQYDYSDVTHITQLSKLPIAQ